MSDTHHDFDVHSEEDVLPGRPISLALVLAIVISVGWVGVAWLFLDAGESAHRPSGNFSERDIALPDTVSNVERTLINVDDPGARLKAAQRAILNSYGWVDEPAGVVRIPIERAIDVLAEDGR